MAIREYRCKECSLLTEMIIPASRTIPLSLICPKCKGEAIFLEIPTGFSLGTSSTSSSASIDVIIGKDSERRWENIYRRQEIRDQVRKESGTMGLSMVGKDKFEPVQSDSQSLRVELNEILPISGYKTSFDSPDDAKLILGK